MKNHKFPRAKDGEWIQPKMSGYLMGCCDCGLVHRMDFRIVQGPKKQHVQFKAERARNYTARLRRLDKIRMIK